MEVVYPYFKEIKVFIYGILLSLNIDIDVSKALVLVMLIDTGFGVAKAIVVPTLTVSIKTFIYGMIVKLLLLMIPLTTALVGKELGIMDFTTMVTILMKAFILSELSSIYNSFLSVKKREVVKQTDFITIIFESIQSYLHRNITLLLELIKKDKKDGR